MDHGFKSAYKKSGALHLRGVYRVSQKKKNKFFFRDFVVIWCNDVRCMNYKGIFYYSELR